MYKYENKILGKFVFQVRATINQLAVLTSRVGNSHLKLLHH